jgi:hypothetical protein
MEPQLISIHSKQMQLLQSVEGDNHLEKPQIQEIRADGNSISPTRPPPVESELTSIHSKKTRILRSAQVGYLFQR